MGQRRVHGEDFLVGLDIEDKIMAAVATCSVSGCNCTLTQEKLLEDKRYASNLKAEAAQLYMEVNRTLDNFVYEYEPAQQHLANYECPSRSCHHDIGFHPSAPPQFASAATAANNEGRRGLKRVFEMPESDPVRRVAFSSAPEAVLARFTVIQLDVKPMFRRGFAFPTPAPRLGTEHKDIVRSLSEMLTTVIADANQKRLTAIVDGCEGKRKWNLFSVESGHNIVYRGSGSVKLGGSPGDLVISSVAPEYAGDTDVLLSETLLVIDATTDKNVFRKQSGNQLKAQLLGVSEKRRDHNDDSCAVWGAITDYDTWTFIRYRPCAHPDEFEKSCPLGVQDAAIFVWSLLMDSIPKARGEYDWMDAEERYARLLQWAQVELRGSDQPVPRAVVPVC
eukprot:GDKH01004863.1.p1 GENE.GDKH01004863.1~~GDKH01004863.1.p1  ORF type:complete len:392 (-),score=29.37 GDKH01004863.1:98-1273(-)